ncbi:SDR family oxidoreductase [Methyloglobulus sp.]|uniref:SDR family oxidoreductase n=1 Tax=Methyloglobulus sp. TaxID=2518622 RepID=UPI0032B852B9
MKNILITSATSDLGANLYKLALCDENFNILSTSRSPKEFEYNGSAKTLHLGNIDLTNETDLKNLAEAAENFFQGQFSVIHFAGDFWVHKPLIKTSFSEIQRMMDSHYLTLCGVAHAITPVMIKKGGGRLIGFSCNSVGYNYPDLSPFTSAKAAVESFLKCYSNEYAAYNIASTAIALPTMKTEKVLSQKQQGDIINYIEPDELSKIILENVLLQSNHITGNIIRLIKHSDTFYNQGYFQRNPRLVPL